MADDTPAKNDLFKIRGVPAVAIGLFVALAACSGSEPDTRAQGTAEAYETEREEWARSIDDLDFGPYEDLTDGLVGDLFTATEVMWDEVQTAWRDESTVGGCR